MRPIICCAALAALLSACAQYDTNAVVESGAAEGRLSVAETLERGRYLVEDVAMCGDCHTPMTPTGPDMSRHLAGAELGFSPLFEMPEWAPVAPALGGVLAGHDADSLAEFLSQGARRDGSTARPPMPRYRFSETDARAIVAYLESLPAPQ